MPTFERAKLTAPLGYLMKPVQAAEHSCCGSAPGLRLADPGCCAAAGVAPRAVAAPSSVTATVAPAFVLVAGVTPPASAVLDLGQAAPGLAISPPLTVRRL